MTSKYIQNPSIGNLVSTKIALFMSWQQ